MSRELIKTYALQKDAAHRQGDAVGIAIRDDGMHLTVKDFPFLEEHASGDKTQPYALSTYHREAALLVPDGGAIEIELKDGTVSIYRR